MCVGWGWGQGGGKSQIVLMQSECCEISQNFWDIGTDILYSGILIGHLSPTHPGVKNKKKKHKDNML